MPRFARSAFLLLALGSCASIGGNRTPADTVISSVANLDCNVRYLLAGEKYCRLNEPPPPPPLFCTRSLGTVDCWDTPYPAGYYQAGVADGPWSLSLGQQWNRTEGWVLP